MSTTQQQVLQQQLLDQKKSLLAKITSAKNRSEEFEKIGNKNAARNTLEAALLTYKKFNKYKNFEIWDPVLEEVMSKYLDLCLSTLYYRQLKTLFVQYRNFCQTILYDIQSLGKVIKVFLEKTEALSKVDISEADKVDLEDLDTTLEENEIESEDDTLSQATSIPIENTEKARRELTFLWHIYVITLETIYSVPKLETLYASTAQKAFDFCVHYRKKSQFSQLCERLRFHHTKYISKHPNPVQFVGTQDVIQLRIDIRFCQLEAAIKLQAWTDSFKSLGDIHSLISDSKKSPKPQTLANFFQKAAHIFLVSNEYLYHAYCMNRYFNLVRSFKSGSDEEISQLANVTLLAIMAIPLESNQSGLIEDEKTQERRRQRISLLSFSGIVAEPNRKSLVEEITRKEFTVLLHPQLRDFYDLMEVKFHPLQFASVLKQKLDFIGTIDQFKPYIKSLETLLFIRLLQQLSKVYDVMKLSEFYKLAPFITPIEAEKLIVRFVNSGYVYVHVDFRNGTLNFKNYESDQFRTQLSTLACNLQQAVSMINPALSPENIYKQKKKEVYAQVIKNLTEEHYKVLARRKYFEDRKDFIEEKKQAKLQKEQEEREEREKELEKEREKKRKEEELLREKAILEKQEKERKKKEFESLISSLKKLGTKVEIDNIEEVKDPENYINTLQKRLENEQKNSVKRLIDQTNRFDWLERAKREEEKPLLIKFDQDRRKEDEEYFYQQQKQDAEESAKDHELKITEKQRLKRIIEEKVAFESKILQVRKQEFEKAQQDRAQRISQKRKQLKEEYDKWLKQKEEREQELERQRKLKEEELEKKRQEDQERKKKEMEQVEKQRKREEEVLAKLRREEEAFRETSPGPKKDWRREERERSPPRKDEGRWRRQDKEREKSPPRKDEGTWRREEKEISPPPRKDEGTWRREKKELSPSRKDEGTWRKDDKDKEKSPPRIQRRESQRDENWRKEKDRSPPRRESSPQRKDEGKWRREEKESSPPRKDEGTWRKDDKEKERSPPRIQKRESQRDENWRKEKDRSPPRREEESPQRKDEGRWKKEARERSPPRKDEGKWRRDDKERERSPPRGMQRRESQRDDDNWRKQKEISPPPRKDEGRWRKDDKEKDRSPPPRKEEGRWRKDDKERERSPPRGMQRRESQRDDDNWRKQKERSPPPRKDEGRWRREEKERERSPPRKEEGRWKRDEKEKERSPPRGMQRKESQRDDEEGWQTVGKKK